MAKVGDSAYTPHGLGKITESVTERGRISHRITGKNFSVWQSDASTRVANDVGFSTHWKGEPQPEDVDGLQYVLGGLDTTIDPGGDYEVNDGNHATLPWNGTPQFDVDMFREDQNIQPGDHEIDPDKRLKPSDSLSGAGRSKPRGPQPNPELFLGGGGDHPFEHTAALHRYAEDHARSSSDPFMDLGDDGGPIENAAWDVISLPARGLNRGLDVWDHFHDKPGGGKHEGSAWSHDEDGLGDFEDSVFAETQRHEGESAQHTGANDPSEGSDGQNPNYGDQPDMTSDDYRRQFGGASGWRPAGLDGRYAFVPIEAATDDSPTTQFQRDPRTFIATTGHLWTDGDDSLEAKYAHYTNLVDHEAAQLGGLQHTAAWRDVRQKASRLLHEGQVSVNDHGPNRMYATVQGDNGVYDVMIYKAGNFGGNQSVLDWACSCEWGRWAFKRKFSFVGRLCSHAYASYLHMQSDHIKKHPIKSATSVEDYKGYLSDNGQSPEAASISSYLNTQANDATEDEVRKLYDYSSDHPDESLERDYEAPYTNDPEKAYKQADKLLRTVPQSLTPDLHAVPAGEGQHWEDVTEDSRKTTGPDQIMKDSARWARYLHGTDDMAASGGDGASMGAASGGTDLGGAASGGNPGMGVPGTGGAAPDANMGMGTDPGATDDLGGAGMSSAGMTAHLHYQGVQSILDAASGDDSSSSSSGGASSMIKNPSSSSSSSSSSSTSVPSLNNTSGGSSSSSWGDDLGKQVSDFGKAFSGGGSKPSDATGTPGMTPQQYQQGEDANVFGGHYDLNSPNYLKNPDGSKSQYGFEKTPDGGSSSGTSGFGDLGSEVSQFANQFEQGNLGKEVGQFAQGFGGQQSGQQSGNPGFMGSAGNPNQPGVKGFGTAETSGGGIGGGHGHSGPFSDTPNSWTVDGQPDGYGPSTGATPGPTYTPGHPGPYAAAEGRIGSHQLYAESDEALLNKLRSLSEEIPDDFGHMDSHNDELRDVTDELNDRGYDASYMVASYRQAAEEETPADGNGDFLGQSSPGFPDQGYAGSGPNPKDWMSDSAGYVEENERPRFEDLSSGDGDVTNYGTPPQQGPRRSSMNLYALHDGMPDGADWGAAGGDEFAKSIGDEIGDLTGGGDDDDDSGGDSDSAGAGGLVKGLMKNPEEALKFMGSSKTGGFSLEAFDRGEFSFDDAPGGGELRRISGLGKGPRQAPRVDAGARDGRLPGQPRPMQASQSIPEDFGFDGGRDIEAYLADAGDEGANNIVAAFHQSGAGQSVMASQPRTGSTDDFSSSPMVQSFLRTAGRVYAPEEQRMLEAEHHPLGARNMPTDEDLAGTHYLL